MTVRFLVAAAAELCDVGRRRVRILLDRRQILLDDFNRRFSGEGKQPKDVEILVWVHLYVEDLRVAGHGGTG